MKKYLDPKYLPYFGALVQGVLFSIAGNKQFGKGGWILGLGVGIVINLAIAIASSRISEIAKNRKVMAYITLILLACFSPVVICSTLGWNIATFSWAVVSDLAVILAGSIAGKSLFSAQADGKTAGAKPSGKGAKPKYKFVCPYANIPSPKDGCKITKPTQNAINAHAGKCKHNPAKHLFATAETVQVGPPTKGKK